MYPAGIQEAVSLVESGRDDRLRTLSAVSPWRKTPLLKFSSRLCRRAMREIERPQ